MQDGPEQAAIEIIAGVLEAHEVWNTAGGGLNVIATDIAEALLRAGKLHRADEEV